MSVYFEVSFKFIYLKIMIYGTKNESTKPNKTYLKFWFGNKRRLKTVIGWHVTAEKWLYGKIPLDYRVDI